MTTFNSDNPGTPISDAWDLVYEQIAEDCEIFQLKPSNALALWATATRVIRNHVEERALPTNDKIEFLIYQMNDEQKRELISHLRKIT